MNHPLTPNWSRIAHLDALYAYNPFDPTRAYSTEPANIIEEVLADTQNLYSHYRKVSLATAKPFFPTLIPGYNDSILRPNSSHTIVPKTAGNTALIDLMSSMVKESLGEEFTSLQLITSWNEWNEGSNVEDDEDSLSYLKKLQHK